LFRREDQSVATLALLPDADGRIQFQFDRGTFKKVSALRVWAQLVAIASISLLTMSSLLFAPVWGLRKLFGKLPGAGPLSVRVIPLLSTVLLMAFDGLLAIGLRGMITGGSVDDMFTLGVPCLHSVSILLVSIAFPLAAAASLYVVYRERRAAMNRMAYWHSVLVTAAVAAVAVYYGYWGLIGFRLWV